MSSWTISLETPGPVTVLIAGGGIGGLTLALALHRREIPCRVFEAAPEIRPLGVGINLLPHAMRELAALGLEPAIAECAIETREVAFYNKYGQFIFSEPRGRFAGYDWPQYSIHRGRLHELLWRIARDRLGGDAIRAGHRLVASREEGDEVVARFVDGADGTPLPEARGRALVGADGIRSALRAELYPSGDPLIYSGITMWRGVTRWPAYLTGASMIYAGWLATGKVIVYPVANDIDADGRQLVNWLCEFHVPPREPSGDWSREGRLEDFFWACRDMAFDWLDIPAMVQAADHVFEYPMVDKDPLARWSFGRRTLLGDAAHPMYPSGSNGAGQAILDVRALADHLAREPDAAAAFRAYEADRLGPTAAVVRANRANPPDAILREVYARTGDMPFQSIDEVIAHEELVALSEGYKAIAGFDRQSLQKTGR